MTSQPCPSADDLMSWLNAKFDPDRQAEIGTHVDFCKQCHTTLEELTEAQAYGLAGLAQDAIYGWRTGAIDKLARNIRAGESTEDARVEHDRSMVGERTELPSGISNREDDPERTEPPASVGESTLDGHSVNPDQTVDSSPQDTEPAAGRASSNRRGTIPSYELLEEIGSGGMGVVYKARQRGLNRLVALKMIRGGERVRPDQLARIRIEAEAVARVRHPNFVHIYEIGEVDGLPFLSLELLEGGTLEDRLAGDPQPGGAAAELMATLARAMQAAHEARIIHRDLKPSNVLFDGGGVPKITDFGLAKRLESDSRQTESGQIMGTPCYMAPEQAMGHTRDVGPAADIYSLGAILYEMLTGRPPFKGETPMETIRQVVHDDVVPPRRLVPKVARDLETICLRALHKEPSRRYLSALALAEDLERFLAGKPIKARRTPFWERGAKLARRRPVATTLCAVGLLGAILTTGAWLDYKSRQRERTLGEIERKTGLKTATLTELLRVKDLLTQGRWGDAEPMLAAIQEKIRPEADFDDLGKSVREMLAQVREGKAIDESRRAIEAARSQDRERYRVFLAHRKDALFHEANLTGLDLPADHEAVRRSTLAALAVFARPGPADSWAMGPLPASLEPREQGEIREGCYELLLTLAEAAERPEQGLRLLEQAAELRPPTQVYHLRRADHLARRGEAVGAESERARGLALKASSALDHFLTGKEEYKNRQWRAARAHFDEALLLQPDHFWAHCLSAVCSLQLTEPVRAKSELNSCLQTEKNLAWLYELRGFASYKVAALARLAAGNLSGTGPTLSGEIQSQLEAAEADFARALELLAQTPNDDLQYALLVNRALVWFERRDWNKAVADLQAASRLNPSGWQAVEILAEVHLKQGQPEQAIEQFTRAITLKPDMASLYRARAEATRLLKDQTSTRRKLALDDLDRAIRLEPADSPFQKYDHTNRGALLHALGQEAEALSACAAALKAAPSFLEAHLLRIDILRRLKRHREVISSCDVVLAQIKPSARLYELRGLAKQDLDDFPGAIEDDTLALALRPGNAAALLARRGGLFLATDAPRSALRDFEASIGLDPTSADSAQAYLGRGLARATLGMHREAVVDARRALDLGEVTDKKQYNAARIFARAAVAATAEVKKTGQDAIGLASRYQDQAIALVRQAVARIPATHRAAYVRDVVMKDPALAALRQRLRLLELAGSTVSSNGPGARSQN